MAGTRLALACLWRRKGPRKRTNDTNMDKSLQVGEWRGLNPEYLRSNREPVFSLTAGVLTRTLWTAGTGGQAACSLTATNDSSSKTHPADGPAPVYHSAGTGYQLERAWPPRHKIPGLVTHFKMSAKLQFSHKKMHSLGTSLAPLPKLSNWSQRVQLLQGNPQVQKGNLPEMNKGRFPNPATPGTF